MPATKSPELLKTQALAQIGGFLSNVPNVIARANKVLTDGLPANAQTGAPAITAAEIVAVVGTDAVAFIQGAAALIPAPAPTE
jgi:hypothetical protein